MRNPKWHSDEIILALDLYFDEKRGPLNNRNPKVVELSKVLNQLPIFQTVPDQERFRNPSGVSLKLSNFLALDPSFTGKGMQGSSKLDIELFKKYSVEKLLLKQIAKQIRLAIKNEKLNADIRHTEVDEVEMVGEMQEGRVLYRLHKLRERNSKIVAEKKKIVLQEEGCLRCEVCGFDFESHYGESGAGYIECHHIVPLANFHIEKRTKLEDLALVCANCHRVLHRNLSAVSIESLKHLVQGKLC